MIHKLGKNAKLAKCDIQSAFRLLRLSPGDFDLLGFKFENQYFLNKCFTHDYGLYSILLRKILHRIMDYTPFC